MNQTKILPYITGMIMALVFGLSFLFAKQGLESLSPMVLLSYRFGIAAIVLFLLILFRVVKIDYKGKPLKGVIALSIFYPLLAFLFEIAGLQYTTTSQAGIMVSLMPIFVMLLGMAFLKERPTALQTVFIVSSVIGVLITVVFAKRTGENSNFFGILLLLISVTGGAVQNVLSRKYSKYFTSIEITVAMIFLAAVFYTVIAVIQGLLNHNLAEVYAVPFHSARSLGAVVYLGVFASVLAFFAMNYTLAKLPAVNAAVFTNLATVISIIAGVLIVKEQLYWYQMVGGCFIIAGVWGTNFFVAK